MNTNKELNLLNQKIVYDFTRFTTTDYIGEIACIVWHISCNMRCSYCYNDSLVFSRIGKYSHNEVLDFLKKRVTLLSAVVLSGGEATIHNLVPFCKEIKKLGYKIKLDTNGTNLKLIKKLISNNLKSITSINSYDKLIETIKYLLKIDFSFELRTTVNTSLIDENDINEIINTIHCIGYNNTYYIQDFLETSSNIGNIKKSRSLNKNLIDNSKLVVEYRN